MEGTTPQPRHWARWLVRTRALGLLLVTAVVRLPRAAVRRPIVLTTAAPAPPATLTGHQILFHLLPVPPADPSFQEAWREFFTAHQAPDSARREVEPFGEHAQVE